MTKEEDNPISISEQCKKILTDVLALHQRIQKTFLIVIYSFIVMICYGAYKFGENYISVHSAIADIKRNSEFTNNIVSKLDANYASVFSVVNAVRDNKALQGVPGATGAKGDIGPIGPQGPIGPKGDIGPQGPAFDVAAIRAEVAKLSTEISALRSLLDESARSTGPQNQAVDDLKRRADGIDRLLAPGEPSSDANSECPKVPPSRGKIIQIRTGTVLCSRDAQTRAIFTDVTNRRANYEVNGTNWSCPIGTDCTFSWADAPRFRLSNKSDAPGPATLDLRIQ